MMRHEWKKQKMHLAGMIAGASVLAALALPVKAQETTPNSPVPAEKCVARPDQDPAVQQPGAQSKTTRKLSECNSVLKPPAVGDPEMVEPAPPVGDTPVIKPGDLPQDQSRKP